jgi:glutaredoxin-related protein
VFCPCSLSERIDGPGWFAGLKKLNEWPTYPQFIVKGEFIGGLDVVTEMVDQGELAQVLAH